jgi:hypothetical protein
MGKQANRQMGKQETGDRKQLGNRKMKIIFSMISKNKK